MLSSWRKASAYWSWHSQQRVSRSSPSAEHEDAAALTYLSDAGENNQAQSGTVEAMLIWRRPECDYDRSRRRLHQRTRSSLPFVSCMTMEAYLRKVMRRLLVCRLGSRGSSGLFITVEQTGRERKLKRVRAGSSAGEASSHWWPGPKHTLTSGKKHKSHHKESATNRELLRNLSAVRAEIANQVSNK